MNKILKEDSVYNAAMKAADRLDAEDNIVWEEDSLEAELESAYRTNMRTKRKELKGQRIGAWNNVLLVGGAGVGKTARVFQWADSHPNIRVEVVDAKTIDPADLGGAVAPDRETGRRAVKLSSDEFNRLDTYEDEDGYVVLFLDELNRAASDVRGSLLTLVNNHQIPDGDVRGGLRTLKGLLFTIAAINPADGSYNTDQLDAAETSRFKRVDVIADNRTVLKYLNKSYDRETQEAIEDGYEDEVVEIQGRKAIANKLLNDPMFRFDDAEDVAEAGENQTQILVPRNLEMLLNESDGTKKSVLKLWSKFCNPKKKGIAENILQDYKDIDNKANSVFKTGQGRLNPQKKDDAAASIFQKKEPSAFDKFKQYKDANGIAFETE